MESISQQEMFWKMTAFCFAEDNSIIYSFAKRLVEYCRTFGVADPGSELRRLAEFLNERLNGVEVLIIELK